MTTHSPDTLARRWINDRVRLISRLSFPDAVDAVQDITFRLVRLAAQFSGTPGAQKKSWVMARVESLIDRLLPMVPLPWFLAPIRPALARVARRWLIAIADRAVETILANLREASA